ncbi:uncharacterized protein K452DRAFT_288618 [Aplosporella prunicola CBS 121167]|uniref:Uncharacterized protein n=1 Tax=Aplosporella prunicola CBS 121167 TaxID=1176127 RepID=A0A6A6B8P2_9PEZI|nr:uncharacterized protein K452DRAFT_288618 [Aplosporella prunicola CBS 121167]KAF2140539.1 hypothetical protein K452DRAFT_288618 [Aplosporella prunicola CBS 121167]
MRQSNSLIRKLRRPCPRYPSRKPSIPHQPSKKSAPHPPVRYRAVNSVRPLQSSRGLSLRAA